MQQPVFGRFVIQSVHLFLLCLLMGGVACEFALHACFNQHCDCCVAESAFAGIASFVESLALHESESYLVTHCDCLLQVSE